MAHASFRKRLKIKDREQRVRGDSCFGYTTATYETSVPEMGVIFKRNFSGKMQGCDGEKLAGYSVAN